MNIDELNYVSPITVPTADADMKQIDCKPNVCKCCGAPLHGAVCDYCGVEYDCSRSDVRIAIDAGSVGRTLSHYCAGSSGCGGNGASGAIIMRYPVFVSGGL